MDLGPLFWQTFASQGQGSQYPAALGIMHSFIEGFPQFSSKPELTSATVLQKLSAEFF